MYPINDILTDVMLTALKRILGGAPNLRSGTEIFFGEKSL